MKGELFTIWITKVEHINPGTVKTKHTDMVIGGGGGGGEGKDDF